MRNVLIPLNCLMAKRHVCTHARMHARTHVHARTHARMNARMHARTRIQHVTEDGQYVKHGSGNKGEAHTHGLTHECTHACTCMTLASVMARPYKRRSGRAGGVCLSVLGTAVLVGYQPQWLATK